MFLDVKKAAHRAASTFGTHDPFRIAKELGYPVLTVPLEGVRGFHLYMKRRHVIYLSDTLTDWERTWVCAHELGHALLHNHMNRIYMAHNTLFPTGRYETEANRFAACLLYPADLLLSEYEGCSSQQISESLGIPVDLVEYSLKK